MGVHGIHHVTAIAGEARENLAFYTRVLGMRLVKRSVNQDDPGTYHLFYADGAGHPGTDLTFFPWRNVKPGRKGWGLTTEVELSIPVGTLDFWFDRLSSHSLDARRSERFGAGALEFRDPHGLELALVEGDGWPEFEPWSEGPVEADAQVRGIHGVRFWQHDPGESGAFLEDVLGFAAAGSDGEWQRWDVDGGGPGRTVAMRAAPDAPRGVWGRGGVHHVAFRVSDDAHQQAVRRAVEVAGRSPTEVIDRFWFRSVYFPEPGGVLFELATDGPGFSVDEDPAHLGESLILPPWLEPYRARIQAALPALEPVPGRQSPVSNAEAAEPQIPAEG